MAATLREKICTTSATGGFGSLVLDHFLNTLHITPSRFTLSLRDPSRLPPKYANINLDVRYGDYNAPNTLLTAFNGASKLLLISYPSIAYSTRITAHRNTIGTARSAGIRHMPRLLRLRQPSHAQHRSRHVRPSRHRIPTEIRLCRLSRLDDLHHHPRSHLRGKLPRLPQLLRCKVHV
jgi:hypothetical protein